MIAVVVRKLQTGRAGRKEFSSISSDVRKILTDSASPPPLLPPGTYHVTDREGSRLYVDESGMLKTKG